MVGLQLIASLFINQGFYASVRLGGRIRAGLVTVMYQKIIKLRNLKGKSVGEVSYGGHELLHHI